MRLLITYFRTRAAGPGENRHDHVVGCSLICKVKLRDGSTHTRSSMSAPAVDYYKILGLPKDAPSEDGAQIFSYSCNSY
jgi:hypothetical protein